MLTNFRTLTSAFIDGDLTASGVVSASCGDSEQWCSTTTVVQSNSGAWGTGGSFDSSALQAASGYWNSTYTTVSTNSASWIGGADYDDSWLSVLTGGWESTYTTVSTNSAVWGTGYDDTWLSAASANWDSTYTTVSSNSGNWNNDLTLKLDQTTQQTVINGAPIFNGGIESYLKDYSGVLAVDTISRTLNDTSGAISVAWDSIGLSATNLTSLNDINATGTVTADCGNSTEWCSTYTTVSSNSAIWGGAGSGDFCSTTVLLNEVSACGGEMSVDGTLSASDMITTTLTADGVYFNTGASRPPELGELVWDETERTLDLGLENGVVLQIGEEQLINVIAGEEIKDGQVVYASGAFSQGNTGKIIASLYSASSAEGVTPGATDELFFIGVATQDIAQDATGYITTFGKVRNISVYDGNNVNSDIVGPDNVGGAGNDPDWPVGKTLYVSTSAGRLTNTPPESPNKIIPTAMVISQSGNGHQRTLFVRQEHGYHIDELHDVRVINPQQNDVLAYNSTLESWDNVTSNNWESTFTTVSSNSADWVTYSTDNISSANWVLDEDNLVSDSAIKVPTQQSVKAYVDGIVTGINSLKGGYDVSTDTPAITAGIGVLQGDSYYVTVSGSFYGQQTADPGDLIIATTDSANLSSEWIVVNRNIQDELIDRWNSTYTTVSTQSASWDSTYTTVSVNSATWDGAVYEVSEPVGIYNKQLALFNDTNEIFKSSKLNWNINALVITGSLDADGLAIGTSGSTFASNINMTNNGINTITTLDMVGTAAISNVSTFNGVDVTAFSTDVTNWNSTYTTVSAQSAAWGIDTVYDDSLLQAASGNWNSTYTTVSANSGIWDNSAALAYNDGATNSIEIGLLDSTTETGNYAITIQGRRDLPDRVASGDYSMAIGRDSKATGNYGIAIGGYATATGVRSVAIGYGANSNIPVPLSAGENSIAIGSGVNYATGNRAIAIGESTQATGYYSAAFGNTNNVTGYSSIAFGAVNKVTGNYSAAFGTNIALSSNDVAEFGMWGNFASNRKRHGAIRCSGDYDSPIDTHYFHVCITALSSQAPLQGGGSVQGNEPSNTIPRNMYTIRRWGNDVYLDANDSADNITTIQLGGGGGNVVETVTSNTYTQPTTTTHTIYNDDDVSVTQDIVATLMNPADHTGTTVHKKIGSSHNVVITPPIGSTIDGAASFTLQFENESVSIFSDGTNFFIA